MKGFSRAAGKYAKAGDVTTDAGKKVEKTCLWRNNIDSSITVSVCWHKSWGNDPTKVEGASYYYARRQINV